MTHNFLSPVEDVLEDARNGRVFILVDAEDRENEGDLVIPAQMCTPEAINFMATHGRGLICLALTAERAGQLNLSLMSPVNESRHQTAFTVSIEARDGITTGISAHDRARTVSVAIDPTRGASDIVSPGHVFPLVARDGGVLVRTGHTEAAVDMARLAGLYPAGVICEVMNDDGSMARRPDLEKFAERHGLKAASIADLIAYRRRHDTIMRRARESDLTSDYGEGFRLIVYENTVEYAEHIALVKGDISTPLPVLVRMHAMDVFGDLLGAPGSRAGLVKESMEQISAEGRGVIVLIRDTAPTAVSAALDRRERKPQSALREYGVGAQILLDLGVKELILLSGSHRRIVGLEGYGLRIVDQRLTGQTGKSGKKS